MRSNQLTHWSLILKELRSKGYLARVILDGDAVAVEIKLGNRETRKLISTALIETAYVDVVALEIMRAVEEVNHAPARRFTPWVAGGKDTE